MSATRCESGLIKTETIQTSNQSRSNNLENFHGIPNLHAWLNGSQRRAQTCSCSPSSDHLATSSSRSLFFRFALSNKRWLWQSPALSNSLVGVPRPHCSCPALCSFLLACHTEGVGPSSWGLGALSPPPSSSSPAQASLHHSPSSGPFPSAFGMLRSLMFTKNKSFPWETKLTATFHRQASWKNHLTEPTPVILTLSSTLSPCHS